MAQFQWSPDRLKRHLDEFARIGTDPGGGITRLSFSKEYEQAADHYANLLSDAGLEVHIDSVGNVVGYKQGKKDTHVLMTGSHLDTVVHGGIFDGTLGALAALEFAWALQDNSIQLEHSIMVVGLAAEEGGLFGGTFGSRAMMGQVNLDDPDLAANLQEAGISMEDIRRAEVDCENITAFLELHIEQGDYLCSRQIPIGIVSGIVGITRIEIEIVGESNHAGTTRMDTRRDAVAAFACLVQKANDIICSRPGLVGTFGVVDVFPNMANIIPGKVCTVLELRHQDRCVIEQVIGQIKAASAEFPKVNMHFKKLIDKPSCQCSVGITECIKGVCENLRIPHTVMASGAGHDANAFAAKVPVGMIFVPSMDGKSHCPDEATEWSDIVSGCQVYFETLLQLDCVLENPLFCADSL
jgi:hydantoinase/carbamoylase family amidase